MFKTIICVESVWKVFLFRSPKIRTKSKVTSNISLSLWFHLEFLLFLITRNAIVSLFVFEVFCSLLSLYPLYSLEDLMIPGEFVRFPLLDFFPDNSNYLFMLSQKYGRVFGIIFFRSENYLCKSTSTFKSGVLYILWCATNATKSNTIHAASRN